MDSVSSASNKATPVQTDIDVPGIVEVEAENLSVTDIQLRSPSGDSVSHMSKVYPADIESSQSQNSSIRHRALVNNAMENGETQITSFTTKEDEPFVGSTHPGFPIYDQQMVNDKPWLESGPHRVDSLQIANNIRLENMDLTEQSLHQIARDGDIFLMTAVLQRISPARARKRLNKKDSDKFTPLHYAARYNHFEMCDLLLKHGADLHSRGEDNLTPLHLVAKYKPKKERPDGFSDFDGSDASSEDDGRSQEEANIRVLEFLISAGARVNNKDFYGLTALHHASLRGNTACVKKLLESPGIAIEATDKQQMTPLHVASIYGHPDIAKMLIDAKARTRCKDIDNGTPLQYASAEGNLEIVNLIFNQCEKSSKVDVIDMLNEKDNDGNTPLHLGVDNGHLHITEHIINRCLANGHPGALNCRRNNKATPLHLACRHGHVDIVKKLIEKGAKLDHRDDGLQTPMMVASQFNHFKVVEYLIECDANLELHDADNYTALLLAASYGHAETIAVLLKHKANIMAVDKNDKSVIFLCAEENRSDALQEFLKRKKTKSLLEVTDRYDNTPLHAGASNGNFAVVKILLDAGAVIDAKNEDEQTPLHLAAQNGSVKIVKELVSKKKEIINDDDEDANTPLHLAALSGRTHCVRELVRLGADIGARNAKQWTPLDCCASVGMHKSAIVLLEADCPVDPKDKRKVTPLHLACQEGHTRMVELLLSWNADITQRSIHGRNALDFAIDHGQVDCAKIIIASDKWREALQNRTKNILTGEFTETPLRKLIRKMPSVAEDVFRKCMRDNGKHKDDINYQISFDYEFMDDEYSCTNWYDMDDNTSEINVPVDKGDFYSKANSPDGEVYDDNGRIAKESNPYTTDSGLLMSNHPLYLMIKSRRETLIRHPLVISLLNHKWKSYGRAVYYTNLLIYIVFLAILNSYMLTVPPPYAIDRNATTILPDGSYCVVIRSEARQSWGTCPLLYSSWQPIAAIIILVLSVFSLVKELYQMVTQRLSYFISVTNLVEIALYVLSILLVIDLTTYSQGTGIREDWQWQCGAAAIFFSWIGLLLFIQNVPRFGIFVLMFTDVMWTFISFFAVFALFILGFAFSFHVLLQNQYPFNQWWNSIIKTFVMMIGEFEYNGIFNEEAVSVAYTDQVYFEVLTYLLFVVFVIIMSIIIMNLLVGLAVDDIKQVQDNAVLESLAMQVRLALDVEYTLPQWLRRRFLRKYRRFDPNQYRNNNWLVKWLYDEDHLNHETIEEALNPDKTDLQNMESKIDVLQGKVRDLRGVMYGLSDRSKQIENMTQAVVNHFKIKWDKEEDDDEQNG